MENVALAMMLCCQKLVPDSYWQPYIKVLPENFNTPLFFTVEQLQVGNKYLCINRVTKLIVQLYI